MSIVCMDLETRPIGRGEAQAPVPVVASIHIDNDNHYLVNPWKESWSWLDDPEVYLLGANVAFDCSVLIRRVANARPHILRALREMRVIDVQHAAKLVDIAETGFSTKYNLGHLSKRYLSIELDKDAWRTDYDKLTNVPPKWYPDGAADYALLDTWTPKQIMDRVMQVRPDALGILAHLTAADWALHEAEINGIYAHPERTRRLVSKVNERLENVTKVMNEGGLLRPDGVKDEAKAREYLVLVDPKCARTPKKDEPSLTAEATEEAAESVKRRLKAGENVPQGVQDAARYVQAYSEFVSAGKLKTTARNLLLGFDLPLQTRFNSCLRTYRTSSSMPDDPAMQVGLQMQNPPRVSGLRECFVAEEGEDIIGADYGQAELFSLAQLCKVLFGFSVLGDVLNSGQDVHIWFASKILGCTYDEAKAHPRIKHYRQLGKVANFGLPGGLGAASLVNYAWANYGVALTEDEAKDLIRMWKAAFPCCVKYLGWVSDKGYPWEVNHPITGFIKGMAGYTDGANIGFQALTAYYAKTACIRVVLACYDPESPLYGFKLWNFVHDELLLRGPQARAKAAAVELQRIMVQAAAEVLPDYPIKADPFRSDVWSKKIPDNQDLDKPFRLDAWIEETRAAYRAASDDKVRAKLLESLEDVGAAA